MTHQTALEIAGFVLVDIVFLGQLVDHADQLRKELLSFCLICHVSEILDCRTRRFLVITVAQTANSQLTDAFFSRLMVCHKVFFLNGRQRYIYLTEQ